MNLSTNQSRLILGHPPGLFVLYFAEMWERFSYYGMRALLIFYMLKGFLGLNDVRAYEIYGAYTALVYMTPYFGGLLADRLLGRRRAVILGGILMAIGHLLMTIEHSFAFFTALGFLIMGNGFFKPNISTIVSELYAYYGIERRKDAGFTIFYMGINLGAAMAPVVCGYIGETYGWHYGFGLATAGMIIGLTIFIAPPTITQLLIGVGALITAIAMPFFQDSIYQLIIRLVLSLFLLVSAAFAVRALRHDALPPSAGAPPNPEKLFRRIAGLPITVEWVIYITAVLTVFLLGLLVKHSEVAGWVLQATGLLFLIYMGFELLLRSNPVERSRLLVLLVLFAFNLLFWAFFEQAGSSINNWTDRNIDRAFEKTYITQSMLGDTLLFRIPPYTSDKTLKQYPLLSQEQLGYVNPSPEFWDIVKKAMITVESDRNETRENPVSIREMLLAFERLKNDNMVTLSAIAYLREAHKLQPDSFDVVPWIVIPQNIGMGIAWAEIPASEFQVLNPLYILFLGLLFSGMWSFLARRNMEPSTPVKFGLGLLQLGLGFMVFYLGSLNADERGMTSMIYLILGWLLITMGELCLSPVGLSVVTKLSPVRIVSTMMGGWFLVTSFSNYLAAQIAKLTRVEHEGASASVIQIVPPPSQTAHIYGEVFGMLGMIATGAAVLCFLLSPLLVKGMKGIR